jgi:hypothetical protein
MSELDNELISAEDEEALKAMEAGDSEPDDTSPDTDPASPEGADDTTPEGDGSGEPEPESGEPEVDPRIAQLEEQTNNLNIALRESRQQNKESIETIKAGMREEFKKFTAKPEVIPDKDEDPLAYQAHIAEQTNSKVESFIENQNKRDQETADTQAQQAEFNNLVSLVNAKEAEFVKSTPDYDDAVDYMRGLRTNELRMLGITDPQRVNHEIAMSAVGLSKSALEAGKNPAEMMYEMAKNYGYTKKDTPPDVNQDFDTIKKGQAASKTLSGGGNAGEVNMGLEGLANLEGDEFDKMWEKVAKDMK